MRRLRAISLTADCLFAYCLLLSACCSLHAKALQRHDLGTPAAVIDNVQRRRP